MCLVSWLVGRWSGSQLGFMGLKGVNGFERYDRYDFIGQLVGGQVVSLFILV